MPMLLGVLGAALLVLLPIIGIVALLKPSRDPGRDRSAKSVEPLACGCILLLALTIVAVICFARNHP